MSHQITFAFPNSQVATLQAIYEAAAATQTADNETPDTWDEWLAALLSGILGSWLDYCANTLQVYPLTYPLPQAYGSATTLAETITLTPQQDTEATAYYSQYAASPSIAGSSPAPIDTLLSGECQRLLNEYCAGSVITALSQIVLAVHAVSPIAVCVTAACPCAGAIPVGAACPVFAGGFGICQAAFAIPAAAGFGSKAPLP
jgi:hypothetical protein